MSAASKRKLPSMGLQRRVRPRREDKWEPEPEVDDEPSEDEDSDEPSEEEVGDQASDDDSESEGSEDQSDSDEDTSAPKTDLSSISFGALARAQASLPSTKRNKKTTQDASDSNNDQRPERDTSKRSPTKSSMKRSSKHAPQEQTSKKPVSRRREIIPTETKRAPARDPRFDPAIGGPSTPLDEARARKAYAFLDKYRDDELAELKVQVKKTRDPAQKEELKRQVMRMESRRKAEKKKQEQEELLREHRAKEKELVAQGKQPFYLKKAEQKKQLLTKRFEGMSKGQRDKTIERKRKKVAGREKKELDSLERRPR